MSPIANANNLIRAILVDDEEPGRITLRYALANFPQWHILEEIDQAATAKEYLENHTVDVVFLDIQMPKENGISLAKSISAMPNPPLIIFVTAYDAHAIDAFEVHALDYLLKPFNAERFHHALNRAQEMLQQKRGYTEALTRFFHAEANPHAQHEYLQQVTVRSVGEMECVKLQEVLWIASASNYVELHLHQRVVLHRMTLSEFEKRIDPKQFLRVHRTTIVRYDQMQKIAVTGDGLYHLSLFCGAQVPVSERYINQVRAQFTEL